MKIANFFKLNPIRLMGRGTEFCALHIHNLHECTIYCVLSVLVYYVFFNEEGLCKFFRCQIWKLIENFFPDFWHLNPSPPGWLPTDRWSIASEMSWKPHISIRGGIIFIVSDDVNRRTGSIVILIRSVIESN